MAALFIGPVCTAAAVATRESEAGLVRLPLFAVLSVPEPAASGVNVNVTAVVESAERVTVAGLNVPPSVQAGVKVTAEERAEPLPGVMVYVDADPAVRAAGPVSV
ncbi:hypothetical protein AA21952_1514 [Acetobacter oeni LMG 21952]|nr:hypothetical protein AA21952_1514 [Acetobacter oeni LMG 21952]